MDKGTSEIDEAARKLESEGLIRYKSVTGLHPSRMPQAIAEADIVVDQIKEANYGSASIEAMHMGKVTVSGISEQIQQRALEHLGTAIPLVNATPNTIEAVLRDLAGDLDRRVELGRAGMEFVDEAHQPEHAANTLWREFLSSRG